MRSLKVVIPAGIFFAGLLVSTSSLSFAKPEYSKKEKKPCTTCHVKTGSKELNDGGKYYKEHNHSLEGYTKK
ncbi:MAG TPA: hypothetical protein VG672_01570 [Bryobacteraceae bacterium]|jgi:hypothetical protein|nr:hypothetical protein [Bryobacteraceae bacterium]